MIKAVYVEGHLGPVRILWSRREQSSCNVKEELATGHKQMFLTS